MKKFVIFLFLLSFSTMMSTSVFPQQPNEPISTLPQGKWAVEQVSIEKNTDGKIENTVYKSAAEVKSYIPCPQELEINEQTVVLHYPGGWEETSECVFKDNQLMILIADVTNYGEYNAKDGSLTLTANHRYVNNLPAKYMERITENWKIILKKQK